MGRVIPFSDFQRYYAEARQSADFAPGTILDTNILIALTYEVKSNHEEVTEFFDNHLLPESENGFRFFTTVNTRSEYLDFNRRLIITECLRDMADEHSRVKITTKAKAQIQYQSGLLKRREQQGGDPVLNDTQVKSIKSTFSAGRFSGNAGWLAICEEFLAKKLDAAEENLLGLNVEYISQHEPSQKDLFSRRIDWSDAKRIAERTCLGLSDAMIINAFQCSRFPFIVSTDFDLGYAVLASKELKDVVMPDSVAKKYRDYHFSEEPAGR
jgi:hypothetical protein